MLKRFEECILDPCEALNIDMKKNAGRTKEIAEICLVRRGITRIHPNFLRFVNLERIWLGYNCISKLENLATPKIRTGSVKPLVSPTSASSPGASPLPLSPTKSAKSTDTYSSSKLSMGSLPDPTIAKLGMMRLRFLSIPDNRISTSGLAEISQLIFLEVLYLSNNRLQNKEAVGVLLRPLRYLKQLDLFGNPISNELNYREFFINNQSPSIEILDRAMITGKERLASTKLFSGTRLTESGGDSPAALASSTKAQVHVAFGRRFKKSPASPLPLLPPLSPSVRNVETTVRNINIRKKLAIKASQKAEEDRVQQEISRRLQFSVPIPGNDHIIEKTVRGKNLSEKESNRPTELLTVILPMLISRHELMTIQNTFEPQPNPVALMNSGSSSNLPAITTEPPALSVPSPAASSVPTFAVRGVDLSSKPVKEKVLTLEEALAIVTTLLEANDTSVGTEKVKTGPPVEASAEDLEDFLRMLRASSMYPEKLTIQGVLLLMVQWPKFCRRRQEWLYRRAKLALKEGRMAEVTQIHKHINAITDHIQYCQQRLENKVISMWYKGKR